MKFSVDGGGRKMRSCLNHRNRFIHRRGCRVLWHLCLHLTFVATLGPHCTLCLHASVISCSSWETTQYATPDKVTCLPVCTLLCMVLGHLQVVVLRSHLSCFVKQGLSPVRLGWPARDPPVSSRLLESQAHHPLYLQSKNFTNRAILLASLCLSQH